MINNVFRLRLSILFFVSFALISGLVASVHATPDLKSVVVLSSTQSNFCASAWALDDETIITNAHVANSLCPLGNCAGLTTCRATELGQSCNNPIKPNNVVLRKTSTVFDLALITLNGQQAEGEISRISFKSNTLPPGGELSTLGFPGCLKLSESAGSLGANQVLYSSTDLAIEYGSSGSPVFDSNNQIAGLVSQSDSLSSLGLGLLFSQTFKARIVPAEVLEKFLTLPDEEFLLFEAQSLERYYREEVRKTSGPSRTLLALNFTRLVSEFKKDLLRYSSEVPQQLNAFDLLLEIDGHISDLSLLPNHTPSRTTLQSSLLLLSLESMLEANSTFNQQLQRVEVQGLLKTLEPLPFSNSDFANIKEVLQFAAQDKYPGYNLWIAKAVALSVVALAILLVLWTLSLAVVFHSSNGNSLQRLCKALVVGILAWPLSLVVYYLVSVHKIKKNS